MTDIRAQKVKNVSDFIPAQELDNGPAKGEVLLLGWGSTYGVLKTATEQLLAEGYEVAHAQVRYLNPFPRNLEEIIKSYQHVIVPENNSGQFVKLVRNEYLVPAIPLNKVQGIPFTVDEIKEKVKEMVAETETVS